MSRAGARKIPAPALLTPPAKLPREQLPYRDLGSVDIHEVAHEVIAKFASGICILWILTNKKIRCIVNLREILTNFLLSWLHYYAYRIQCRKL
jgi:hypothetical protein